VKEKLFRGEAEHEEKRIHRSYRTRRGGVFRRGSPGTAGVPHPGEIPQYPDKTIEGSDRFVHDATPGLTRG
jgi:hypothetical protein